MPSTFKTNPVSLRELLEHCASGEIQLPDFQRSWVWDDDRIRSLIASVSLAFPVGALLTLEQGGKIGFKPRKIQGAPEQPFKRPSSLLLDGQQRMTSLFQTSLRKEVVETVTARNARVRRWYYLDMRKSLDPYISREEAIIGVPEDRVIRSNFGKNVDLDLSTPDREYEHCLYPVNSVFDWDDWREGFIDYWDDKFDDHKNLFKEFRIKVLQNFKDYHVPVISLDKDTSKEAVCLVFEKVNTGGKPLDAFELVTAMFAAEAGDTDFRLRDDWDTRRAKIHAYNMLGNVANTEFLQVVSLLQTKAVRKAAEAEGKRGRELPPASATRHSLLRLSLIDYQNYAEAVERGFVRAAKFLRSLRIYRAYDVPYQAQITALAAILADIGEMWDHEVARRKLVIWFWNGVFSELYGAAAETRIARDILEVPAWINGGLEPSTITQKPISADRLLTMRSRSSAAYKGVNALLMQEGARDFRSGQAFDDTVFFDESVDIHHIFPRDWCGRIGIPAARFDSIVNKTPLTARTNRILGGVAPSYYLGKLETGGAGVPPISRTNLDGYLESHLIAPDLLRADGFDAFITARQEALLLLIEKATGRTAHRGRDGDEPDLGESDADVVEAT